MKFNNVFLIVASVFLAIIIGCKKEDDNTVYGCTVAYALNYNSLAESTDGSCKYAGQYVLDSITLVQFPVLDGAGAPWDVADGPDVYFEFRNNQNALIYSAAIASDLSGEYTWNLDPTPFIDADTNLYFNLKFFDSDAATDPTMAFVNPYFFNYTAYGSQQNKYPNIFTLVDDSVIIELHGSWIE